MNHCVRKQLLTTEEVHLYRLGSLAQRLKSHCCTVDILTYYCTSRQYIGFNTVNGALANTHHSVWYNLRATIGGRRVAALHSALRSGV